MGTITRQPEPHHEPRGGLSKDQLSRLDAWDAKQADARAAPEELTRKHVEMLISRARQELARIAIAPSDHHSPLHVANVANTIIALRNLLGMFPSPSVVNVVIGPDSVKDAA